MRRFWRKLCCCFRPQTCKRADLERSLTENGQKHRNGPPPVQATTPPDSIITQVTKDPQEGYNQPRDPKGAGLRASLRNASNAPVTSLNGALMHSYNNGAALDNKKRQRNQQEVAEGSLLPPKHPIDQHKKCLIIDLDETLVHSSFKPVKNADFVIPVEIDNVVHQVHVLKRPYADEFLQRCSELFECVLFTASLDMYADPVANLLDKRGVFRARLFREACVFHEGNYVKDLNRLGRELDKVIIVDNSPISYAFHPENALAVKTWFDDPNDSELLELIPILEELAEVDDIYQVLRRNYLNPQMAKEFLYG